MHRRALGWALTLALLAVAPQGRTGQVAHPGRDGAPAGLCAAGRATPGRPGAPILRTLLIPAGVAVAVDEATGRAFVVAHLDDASAVCVLDARSGALLHSVQDGGPLAIAVSAPPSRVLVADFEGGSVRVLDARTGAPLRTIAVGSGLDSEPQAIAVDSATGRAFVSNQDGTLSVLDTHTDRLLRTVQPAALPAEVVADVPTGRVFLNLVPDQGGAIALFDARSGAPLRTIRLPDPARVEALDARTGRALVALNSPGSEITGKAPPAPAVSAILSLDGTTGAVRLRLDGFNPAAHLIAVDSRTRRAFVSTGYSVVVLDLTRF